jgi:hypothetical protein
MARKTGFEREEKMAVSVQAVAGAIRATKTAEVSSRYTHAGAKHVRSAGVYTFKNYKDEIVLDYWTGGYQHHADRKDEQLADVITTLSRKGYAVIANPVISYGVEQIQLVVVEAN